MNFLRRLPQILRGLPQAFRGPHRMRAIGALAGVVVIVGVAVGFAVTPSSKKPPVKQHHAATTTTTTPKVSTVLCPLTDTPASGGVVPKRPALLVKIGNEPDGARPQSGLNEADIVYDTPAEGFVMRYVAVYQCNNASSIGPTRSVRWVDWQMIARPFVTPILAYAGGIDPNVNGIAATYWLSGANLLEGAQAAGTRISSRLAPDNLYTSTEALYGLYAKKKRVPGPVFDYSRTLPPGASPAATVGINFSYGTDALWKWDPTRGTWLHTYSGVPDIDVLTGRQVETTNIVIQIVHYQIGPYSEHGGPGNGDIESNLIGSGPGYVLRNGQAIKVTWHRTGYLGKTTFTNAAGQSVALAPGRTWVEIDPAVQADAPGGITVTR